MFNRSACTVTLFDGERYHSQLHFIALLLIISFAAFIAAVLSTVLRAMTLAPDIIGYASSFTYHNLYFAPRSEADGSFGLERARALQGDRIMIGDVASGAEIGRIAFASTSSNPQRIERGRSYLL